MEKPVNFKQNLQILRKRAGLSQEGLAEKMDVSRQAVSKWESGEAHPEMKVLLALCDLFGVSLDDLIRGSIEAAEVQEDAPLRQKYEKLIRRRAALVPAGVGLILVGVMIMLALRGVFRLDGTDFEPLTIAPLLALVAIAAIMFVIAGNDEDDFKRRYHSLPELYTADEVDAAVKKPLYFIAAGIGVIILGVAALMVLLALGQDDVLAMAALLGFVAFGVPLIIHGGIIKDGYDIEKYNQENSAKTKSEEEKIGAAASIIMMLATVIYLITGFAFNLWDTTWWVFPVGGVCCGIAVVIIKSRKG